MDKKKREMLEAGGWKVGDATDFLGLTPEESAYIELRLKLSKGVSQYRRERKLTQAQLAKLIGSSQSRIAKAEGGEASVSLDLLIRTLLAMGASRSDLARLIA